MEEIQCEICGKVIEGYNPNHVEYLLKQHQLTHEYGKDKKDKQNELTNPDESD